MQTERLPSGIHLSKTIDSSCTQIDGNITTNDKSHISISVVDTPYSAHMSPESTHKLMGLCMEVLMLGVIL